jgi:hypothetical protein
MTPGATEAAGARANHVELELELRRLPGVSFVALEERGDGLAVQLLAVGAPPDAVDDLRDRSARVARAFVSGPVDIAIDTGTWETPAANERVELLAVLPSPDGTEVEVHLAFGEQRTVGRGRTGLGPSESAAATLDALRALRLRVPYTVSAASGLESAEGADAVVVVLSAPGEPKRYGVASGTSRDVAAARATLHALNRSLHPQHEERDREPDPRPQTAVRRGRRPSSQSGQPADAAS